MHKITENKKDADLISRWIQQYGRSSSITLLDPWCDIFTIEEVEGAIGYRARSSTAIVFGEPVCAEDDKFRLCEAFQKNCKEKGLSPVYVTVSEDFTKKMMGSLSNLSILVGEELSVNPQIDCTLGSKGKSLRSKLNQAKRNGIEILEYKDTGDESLEKELESVGSSWLKGRKGWQIYLAQVSLFSNRIGKRWFYAVQKEKIIGVCLLQKIEAKEGWLVQILMADPKASIGTSELLIEQITKVLRNEQCLYLSFGVAQLKHLEQIEGISAFSMGFAKIFFAAAKKIFSLDGRRRYWRKFQPQQEKTYLLMEKKRISLKQLIHVMQAFHVPL